MAKKSVNAIVIVEPGEPISNALSKFKKQCRRSGMHQSLSKHYLTKSEKRRAQKHAAIGRRRKYEKKLLQNQLRRKNRYQKGEQNERRERY